MARYSPAHKATSRANLLEAAARLFRRHGYDGVGIAELTAAAGLTRGAFYGHFESKAALYAESLAGEHDFVTRLQARDGTDDETLNTQAIEVACGYLEPGNRPGVLSGCSMAALAMDTVRGPETGRSAYAKAFVALCSEFGRGLEGADNDPDERAIAAALTCVGGLLLSGAVGNEALAERISRTAQQRVTAILREPPADS